MNSRREAELPDGYAYSSSGTSLTIKDVQIGAQTINQDLINTIDKDITLSANSKAYICDKLSPMFGVKKDKNRGEVPEVAMQHLASIAAIKIVNKGDGGDIVVSSIEITAPEAIVGEFEIVITDNDNVSFTATNASSTARVELASPTSIKKDGHIIIYVPIKPFEASNKDITIAVNGNTDKEKGYGSYRTVKMPANTKFQAGKVTTLKVPVNVLNYHYPNVDPATSNVITAKGSVVTGTNYGGITGLKPVSHKIESLDAILIDGKPAISSTININGYYVNAYVVGSESTPGTIIIRGTARDLIPYAPMEFYAASWHNQKAVMRLENLLVYMWDIPVAHKLGLSYSILTEGDNPIIADKSKITFSGLMPLEQVPYNNEKYSVILDEEPYHKPVSDKKIEDLLANFDDNKADDELGYKPTFEGLVAAITNPSNVTTETSDITKLSTSRDITAFILWSKINKKVASSSFIKGVLGLFTDFLDSPKDFFEIAAHTPIEVTISTVPQDTDGATDCRMVFWGLNSKVK